MAQGNGHTFDVPSVVGSRIPDTRIGRSSAHPMGTAARAAMHDIGAMRTYLASQSASTYTSAVLDSMTANDMAYAIRCIDGGGIGSVAPAGIR